MSYDRFCNYSEKYQYFQNFQNPGFSGFPKKTGSRIRNFFGLKPSRDQDGANKKKFSQIGPAVLEEIGRKHTHIHTNTQTSFCYILEIDIYQVHHRTKNFLYLTSLNQLETNLNLEKISIYISTGWRVA